ncbi:MAG: hypothetical protein HDR30_00735 [Lachnospiraceae bacterium]|nr:hypothetical protein [Lachnospiraceae bacterium]
MSFLDRYISMISKKNIGGEEMLNLHELVTCIELDKTPSLIEECIIMPYYIDQKGRYELYQYEFRVESMNKETFEEYILRITGKKKIDDVADNIIRIRQICYAKLDRNNQNDILKKIKDYFYFLINSEDVQKEIVDIFGEFNLNNLYICIY